MKKREKKVLLRIILSFFLLAVSFFIPAKGYLKLLIFIIPYIVIGYDVLLSAVRNILCGQVLDEQFLMSVATLGALILGEYTEAVAVMLFYQIGELFQSIAVGKSRKSISALMDIRPEVAFAERGGEIVELSPEDVLSGEIIVIRPGERVPLDGIIIEGESSLSMSALTGESLPREAATGDKVISGSVNLTGLIRVQTVGTYAESTVSKILELVENSAEKKAKTEKFISKFARYYTPIVVGGALLIALIPPIFTGDFSFWIRRGLVFLIVSCPCALVISVPMSFFGGIGGASRRGILIKGATYIETLSKVDTVVFDKTGTLTEGSFSIASIHPSGIDEEELLALAASAESGSNHPIAISILKAFSKTPKKPDRVTEEAGLGICAEIDGNTVYAGNARLMLGHNIEVPQTESNATALHVAKNGVYIGYILISDSIKKNSPDAIKALKALGIKKTVMLTGDKKDIGEAVASELKIDCVLSELMPKDKVTAVEDLLSPSSKLVYVGDGINDAPVLCRADVGIAMGALGSDAAIEAADIVLMDDDPRKIATAIRTSKKTMNIVKQNIAFALSVKGLVLILGALGFAGMWLAIFSDVGVMVIAIINAMRAMK